MHKGVSDAETMDGLVGGEAGHKLRAFLKTKVDLNQLLENPEMFASQEFSIDARYMSSLMLSTWLQKNIKKPVKAMPLLDVMTHVSREFLLLICTSMSKQKLIQFIKALINHDSKYKDLLSEIALDIKESISV